MPHRPRRSGRRWRAWQEITTTSRTCNTGATPIFACGTIDTPGSYVVVQNIDAIGDCLLITADDVTIDLGGHVLTGDTTGTGVKALLNGFVLARNLTVRDGTVKRFTRGIDLPGAFAVVSQVRAFENGSFSIAVGRGAIVADNIASRNGGDGILAVGGSSRITGNLANGNNDDGFQATVFSTITGNTATGNGSDGIIAGGRSLVAGNTASGNDGNGLTLRPSTGSG